MDVDGPGGILSPATEEETVARKRSRRVSFADTTAVHVFDRDEDFETPVTPPGERSASASPSRSPQRSSAEAEDGDDTEDEEFQRPPVIFMPDIDSSSPGSAVGSVASTDDENFFGPVSTGFIQSGRPSDCGMSEDDNHDITMDSRTFSLHFRNIDPPDDCTANSAGSLMTPNMVPVGPKELNVSGCERKSSNRRGTLTDMSVRTGNPRNYEDYGELSATLNNVIEKIEKYQQTESPQAAVAGIAPDDNPIIFDGHEKSQENCNHNHIVDPGVNNTVEPPAKLSPLYISSMSNVGMQSHQSLTTDQPSGTYDTTNSSSLSNGDLESHLLDQPLSKDQPPGMNHSAVPAFSVKDVEQLNQQNEVMDTEIILHTPKTVGQLFQVPQGSTSSLSSKRQKLFSITPLSKSKDANMDACSLDIEVVNHEKRISALENVLKLSLESPSVAFLLPSIERPSIERNKLGLRANEMFSNTEDHNSTLSISCNSVPRQQLSKTTESFILGTPSRLGPNEATKIQSTSVDVALDNQPALECNSLMDLDGGGRKRSVNKNGQAVQDQPEETAEAARSPIKSKKPLSCISQSSYMIGKIHDGANDIGKAVNVDWDMVACTISNATEQVFSASISKLNLQQLDMLGDKLDEIQMDRKYRWLCTAVRIHDCCSDKQKRLAEARSLHDKLLYEKAKLQINNMKLAKFRNRAQLCQLGIQECCFLKCKILSAAQMKDASFHMVTPINASDRQEGLAIVTKKRLELNIIQQKVDNLRTSLECFHNIKGDISCDSVTRSAEEQLDARNQCHIIQQQAGLWELGDIVKRDNKRDVILNYRNLLFQRIILNISRVPSIFVNNSLNGARIAQTFPNLDASVAFNFIFKAEENHRESDLQSLQKKTMETSLLLGNLIDVLHEIKFAKLELMNLTSATFVLESQTCQLALRLCFMSFKTGKRIGLILDMTDLNRSVYPSEPSELLIKVCEAQTTLAPSSIDATTVSIRNLQPGRTVILRLCRMVSQLICSLPG